MLHTQKVEALSLGNLDPRINDQFSDALAKILEQFGDESERFSTGDRTASVDIKVTFKHNLERRSTSMEVSLSTKLPRYRNVMTSLRTPRGGNRFLIEIEDAEQLDMYTGDPDAPKGAN